MTTNRADAIEDNAQQTQGTTSLAGGYVAVDAGDLFATSLLGVTRLFTPELLVMLDATAVA